MKRIFITVYILLVATLFTIPFGIGPIVEFLFKDDLIRADRDISRGTFFLIAEQLEGLDPDGQKAVLEKLQPQFGYPLALYHLSAVKCKTNSES